LSVRNHSRCDFFVKEVTHMEIDLSASPVEVNREVRKGGIITC